MKPPSLVKKSQGGPKRAKLGDALQGLGEPMTRSRAKKVKEGLSKEVTNLLFFQLNLEGEAFKMVQMIQVDEGPIVGA